MPDGRVDLRGVGNAAESVEDFLELALQDAQRSFHIKVPAMVNIAPTAMTEM